MIPIIDVNQRVEFISTKDTTDPKTVFVMKPLTGGELLDLSQFIKDGSIKLSGSYLTAFIEKSIVEIKNIPEGMSIKQVIDGLSPSIISEMTTEIAKINHMTGQDEKN